VSLVVVQLELGVLPSAKYPESVVGVWQQTVSGEEAGLLFAYYFRLRLDNHAVLTTLCCSLYQDNIVMQFHSSILSLLAVVGSLVGHVHADTNIFNDAAAHDDVQLDKPSFTTLHGHSHNHSHCGTYQPSPEEMAIQEAKFNKLLKAKAKGNVASSCAARDKININVYFHVIMSSTATGNLTDTQIIDQMSVLNNDFTNTLFVFNLVSVNYTKNDSWFNVGQGKQEEFDMKDALHMGGSADLNIYTAKIDDSSLLGWATFPWEVQDFPKKDGVVLNYRTLPGGDLTPFNLGATATHEVGHWLGLYHTFHEGCDVGDLVDDTPAEAEPSSGCPIGRDTCPSPGLDPIENFMDYSDDACLNQFTTGQATRMYNQWDIYRAGNLPATSKPSTKPSFAPKPTKKPTKPSFATKVGKTKNPVMSKVVKVRMLNDHNEDNDNDIKVKYDKTNDIKIHNGADFV
jgi:hypothetical protein